MRITKLYSKEENVMKNFTGFIEAKPYDWRDVLKAFNYVGII